MIMREELKKFEADHNVHMSFLPIIIKAVSLALKKFPRLNAILDKNMENITCKVGCFRHPQSFDFIFKQIISSHIRL